MSRQLPVECPHGKVLDWGGFGGDDSEPEFCAQCSPLKFLASADRNRVRDIVWREVVRIAKTRPPATREAIEKIGIFAFMDAVDVAVDAIYEAARLAVPPQETT